MSRNGSGTYVLPAVNPVSPGTVIASTTYNSTMTDIGAEITASLPRDGQAPMSGVLKIVDGTITNPGFAFNSDAATGIYRAAANSMSHTVSGVESQRWLSTGTSIPGTLAATGAATLGSTLGVTGAVTLSNTLGVTGAANFASTLNVTGALTVGSLTSGGALQVFNTNSAFTPSIQNPGTSINSSSFGAARFGASTGGSYLFLGHSRNATYGAHTALTSADAMGGLIFEGSDGTGFYEGSRIQGVADGTQGTGSTPGSIDFYTTPTGSTVSTLVLRLRQNNIAQFQGAVTVATTLGVTGAVTASSTLGVTGAVTGSSTADFSGNVTAPRVRLTSTTDASLASTNHGFQIGPDAGANLVADGNEIMARNNGAVTAMFLQNDGGTLGIGGDTAVAGRLMASYTQYPAPAYGQAGDVYAARSAIAGALYFGDSSSSYLYCDGTDYNFGTGPTGAVVAPRLAPAAGTAAAPSITFDTDRDTGLYRYSTNVIGFATGGTAQAYLGSTGNFNLIAGSGALLMGGDPTRFETSEITVPASTTLGSAISHGGSRAPDIVQWFLRCKTTEGGWAVGTEIPFPTNDIGSTTRQFQSASTASTIRYHYIGSGAPIIRDTTGAQLVITAASWRIVGKCLWL